MNLHAIASPAIANINPFITATLRKSTGYTTQPDGKRTPLYSVLTANIQVQAVSEDDLRFIDSQGIQGVLRNVYLNGNWQGIVQANRQGGDMMIFNKYYWKVVHVLESWPDWTKIIVVQISVQDYNAGTTPANISIEPAQAPQ